MDRQIIYSGQVPQTTDLLNTNKNMMVAMAKLAADILGTSTLVSGLACSPTSPASMSVNVGPGQIYQMENIDNTPYSSIAADTSDSILKQGIAMAAQSFALTAPATAGYSQNYLIQATYLDSDINSVVLPYYNSANPSQAFNGPSGNGTAQPTTRAGQVSLQLVAGVAAATGTQQTPAVTAGYVGLWVITVANGQATITGADIAEYPGAPFFPGFARLDGSTPFTALQSGVTPPQFDASTKLATMAAVQKAGIRASAQLVVSASQALAASDIGKYLTFNANNAQLTLPAADSIPSGNGFVGKVLPTIEGCSLLTSGTDNIQSASGNSSSYALSAGDTFFVVSDGVGIWSFVIESTAAYVQGVMMNAQSFSSSGTFTVPANTTKVRVRVWGAGGGGGSTNAVGASGGGGGAGGYAEGIYSVTPGQSIAVTIGAGGAAAATNSSNDGSPGGSSSFGSYCSATGGQGGHSYSTGATGGTGGTGSGGTIVNAQGAYGGSGVYYLNSTAGVAGAGGNGGGEYGGGGGAGDGTANHGNVAFAGGFGSGGGGAGSSAGSVGPAADGGPGLVVVYW